jgi:hypothetical protein
MTAYQFINGLSGVSFYSLGATVDLDESRSDLKNLGGFFITLLDGLQSRPSRRIYQRAVSSYNNRPLTNHARPHVMCDKNELASINHNADLTKFTEKSGSFRHGFLRGSLVVGE